MTDTKMDTYVPPNGDVLFVSDTHIGAAISNFHLYEKSFREEAKKCKHVVLMGDIFELFYIADKTSATLRTESPEPDKHTIELQINSSIEWLKNFIEEDPERQVYFVLGNHENIKEFRDKLRQLKKDEEDAGRHNFKWSSQAIRLGDALITHGDLAVKGQTDTSRFCYKLSKGRWEAEEEMEEEVRDAQNSPLMNFIRTGPRARHSRRKLFAFLEYPGQTVTDWLSRPERLIPKIYDQLMEWAGDPGSKFYYRVNGEKESLPPGLEGIEHVFTGHTHFDFANKKYKGILFHNSGSFTMLKDQYSGVLKAKLENGKVTKVRQIDLDKERLRPNRADDPIVIVSDSTQDPEQHGKMAGVIRELKKSHPVTVIWADPEKYDIRQSTGVNGMATELKAKNPCYEVPRLLKEGAPAQVYIDTPDCPLGYAAADCCARKKLNFTVGYQDIPGQCEAGIKTPETVANMLRSVTRGVGTPADKIAHATERWILKKYGVPAGKRSAVNVEINAPSEGAPETERSAKASIEFGLEKVEIDSPSEKLREMQRHADASAGLHAWRKAAYKILFPDAAALEVFGDDGRRNRIVWAPAAEGAAEDDPGKAAETFMASLVYVGETSKHRNNVLEHPWNGRARGRVRDEQELPGR